MSFLILLLFALDSRVFGLSYTNYATQNLNEAEVVNYNEMGGGICPKNKDPVCATDGQVFLYFENKCLLEVMNFEQLLLGLREYYECALSFCNIDCSPCEKIYDPVCAIELLTGKIEDFLNPCEVNRRICTTQKDYRIISSGQCISESKLPYGCPVFCTLERNPVCAQFNKELREFANNCELQKEICETKKNWQIVDIYECNSIVQKDIFIPFNSPPPNSECPEWCTLEYRPICARFMTLENEFANECELKVTICKTKQKWDIIRHGPCQESNEYKDLQPTPKCPEFCPTEFSPVCAKFESELKEFSNKCELESLICKTGADWQIIYKGPCSVINESPRCCQFCTADYKPICAKLNNEFREFSNSCVLGRTICESNEKWEVVNLGTCSSSSCPKVCSTDYEPVCAKLDNEFREFTNKCVLESWNCKSEKKWEFFSTGTCPPIQPYSMSLPNICPKFCTRIYDPVCAIMGNELKEFSNKCVLDSWNCESKENWEIVYFGSCALNSHNYPPQLSNCPQFCTRDYRPVCAQFNFELKEFPNKCEFLRANCESKKVWKIVTLGPCSASNLPKIYSKATTSKILNCSEFCTKEYNPVCAKFESELREFGNECELRKTICETYADWYILHRGTCRTAHSATTTLQNIYKSTPKVEAEDKGIYLRTDSPPKQFTNVYTTASTKPKTTDEPSYTERSIATSKTTTKPEYTTENTTTTLETTVKSKYTSKPTTTTTLENTTITEDVTTNKPIYTTNVYTTASTTPKTTDKPSYTARSITTAITSPKPEYTTEKSTTTLETTVKLKYTSNPTTTSTLENTTTTTATVNYIKTSTTNKPTYAAATTPKTITATTTSSPRPSTPGYMHSSEDYSTQPDNSSTEYYEETYNNCGCSNEDNAYYSEEDTGDETYDSWESMDHEGDDISSRFYETQLVNRTDKNTYSNNYNDTESTSNLAYAEVTTETYKGYSDENNAGEKTYAYKNDGKDPTYTIAYENDSTETYEKYSDANIPSEGTYSYKDDVKDPTYTIAYGNDATEKYEGHSKKNNPSKETYSYKNDGKDSTYTIAYGNDSTEAYEKYSDAHNPSEGTNSYKNDVYTFAYGEESTETYKEYLYENNPSEKTYSYKNDGKASTYTFAYGKDSTETYKEYSDQYNSSEETYSYNSDAKNPLYTIAYGNDFTETYKGYFDANSPSEKTLPYKSDVKDPIYTFTYGKGQTETYNSEDSYNYKHKDSGLSYTFINEQDSTKPYDSYTEETSEENISEKTIYMDEKKYLRDHTANTSEISRAYNDTKNMTGEIYENYSNTAKLIYTTIPKAKQPSQAAESQYDNDRKSKNYIELNSHNNIQTYLPVTKYPGIQSSDQNNNAVEYSTQAETNYSDNTENILEVFESLLTKSDEEEDDDETIVKQVLTSNYPTYDEIETPLNYTKNNFTSNKKEEIYNGVVYKAPVYDAPTYNFIYTAPNHPFIPYNYPGIVPNYGRTVQNSYNPFVPKSNQSNAEIAAEPMSGGNIPFNPLQFLYSLAAMSRTDSAAPNLMPAPPVMDYGRNIPTLEYNQPEPRTAPILSDLKLPSRSFNSPVYKQILTQTHPLPQMFLPHPPVQVLSPLYSHYAHPIPNLLSQPQNGIYENNQQPTDNSPINGLANIPPHPLHMPYFYPPMSPQMPPHTAPVPYNSSNASQISFNSTLFNQIVETLKTIVTRH